MQARSVKPALLTSILLLLAALSLTAFTSRNPYVAKVGINLISLTSQPIQRGISLTKTYFRDTISNYIFLTKVKYENRSLLSRVEQLEMLNVSLIEEREENKRLKKLLNFKENKKLNGITARVIALSTSDWVQTMTVDKGLNEKVKEGMAVIAGNGLLGQITSVNAKSAQVLLITDHSSSVDVILQSTRARGVLDGQGKDSATLNFVSSEYKVKVGERVLTSGFDSIYPRGILVGTVISVDKRKSDLDLTIEVKTAVNTDNVEEVTLIDSNDVSQVLNQEKQNIADSQDNIDIRPWCSDEDF